MAKLFDKNGNILIINITTVLRYIIILIRKHGLLWSTETANTKLFKNVLLTISSKRIYLMISFSNNEGLINNPPKFCLLSNQVKRTSGTYFQNL